MNFTKKFDRAFQWTAEKMGAEAKTTTSDDFKQLELEMKMRFEGMDRLQKSMNAYVKWLGRRGETFEDKEKGLPVNYLGRTMVAHGEEFEPDSDFGNCLISLGRANERVSAIQEAFVADATTTWLESLERSLAMMKEYQAARKKLESRRISYDASMAKVSKAKRDDFRLEEELRTAKAKYEESSEDVVRRMQDIRDAEADSVRDITSFLDAELDYHERCAEELRRVRQNWAGASTVSNGYGSGVERRPTGRSRSNTAHSYTERLSRRTSHNHIYEDENEPEPEAQPVRMPIRSNASSRTGLSVSSEQPDVPRRPSVNRASTFQGGASMDRERVGGRISGTSTPKSTYAVDQNIPNVGSLRGQLRPVSRINTNDIFADRDDDTASGSGSPDWADRSATPASSVGSLSRTTSNSAVNGNGSGSGNCLGMGTRKAPPPPPPSRSKKPPPPVPARRDVGY
ncbi:Endophilin-A2 [Diplogelasinospora grovesii]|uniref:Endophilin-A2 n=1 Tax=Diplogelasinospora grovesii TaxID=303347 RepID=A0AAN6NC19_9PEZI|nr:Endophilin-A2 [Diplogelasinospora grovesii]